MEVIVPQVISNVPAFLTKLWKMVDDPETSHLITWGDEGNSFVIHNQSEFAASLLPYYYKHSNMASFVRQLNMYGFHKVVGVESGGLKSEKVEEMEFAHPCFLRGHEHLLESIKRKASNKANIQYGVGGVGGFVPALQDDRVNEVLTEVSQLKNKQMDMDGKLDTMKKENEALWREVVNLRQKHLSQQKIVNKLIQFLVSLVQPRMTTTGGAVKGRYTPQLAIEDSGLSREAEEQRRDLLATAGLNSGSDFITDGSLGGADNTTATFTLGPDNTITSGPVIHDVTHDIGENKKFNFVQSTTPTKVEQPRTPHSTSQLLAVDPKVVSPAITINQPQQSQFHFNANDLGNSTSKPSPKRPALLRELSREDMDLGINTVQKDLDNLKDLLSGQITVDSSLISNLFNPEEPLSSVFSTPSGGFEDLSSGMTINALLGANKLPIDMESGSSGGKNNPSTTPGGMSPGASISTLDEIPLSLTSQNQQEDGPGLFELTDLDGDEPLNTPLMPTGESTSNIEKPPKMKVSLSPPNASNTMSQDDILNTPIVFGDLQDNPFAGSIKGRQK